MLLAGIVMLGKGADWLVEGASRIALQAGVRPMVVGLTIVGFGTSMPELSVSVLAAARGSGALSLGNAVGSNIMNLLLVLGASAVIYPMVIASDRRSIVRDLLFGLLPAAVLMALVWDGQLSRTTAILLLVLFVLFFVVTLRKTRQGPEETVRTRSGRLPALILLTAVGITVLVLGAELLVRGGTIVARAFGVSEAVIGLSLVSFGTSLPELATSVVAAVKRETEISVGNVLGSNMFNLGLVVGTAFTIRPAEVPLFVIRQDIPLLTLATMALGLLILVHSRIGRRSGATMLVAVAAYLVFLFVRGG
jgi:cation:H+ antiporter